MFLPRLLLPIFTLLTLLACEDKTSLPPAPKPAPADEDASAQAEAASPETLIAEGKKAYAAGQLEQAHEHFITLYKQDRQSPEALYHLGRIALDQDEPKVAYEYFAPLYEAHPDNAEYHYFYAESLGRGNNPDKALQELSTLISTDDTGFSKKDPRPHLLRAKLYRKAKKPKHAIADFEAALAIDPKLTEAHHGLARAAFLDREWARAASAVETAQPDPAQLSSEMAFILGMSYLKMNQPKLALPPLETARASGFAKDDDLAHRYLLLEGAELHATLGFLYRDLKQPDKAAASLSTYLKESTLADEAKRQEIQDEIDRLK